MDRSSSGSCGSALSRNASQSRSRLARWLSCNGTKPAFSRGAAPYRANRCCSARGTRRFGRSAKSNANTPLASSTVADSVAGAATTGSTEGALPAGSPEGAVAGSRGRRGEMASSAAEATEGLPEVSSESEGSGRRELRNTLCDSTVVRFLGVMVYAGVGEASATGVGATTSFDFSVPVAVTSLSVPDGVTSLSVPDGVTSLSVPDGVTSLSVPVAVTSLRVSERREGSSRWRMEGMLSRRRGEVGICSEGGAVMGRGNSVEASEPFRWNGTTE